MGCATSKNKARKSFTYVPVTSSSQNELNVLTVDPTLRQRFTPLRRLNTNYPFINNEMHIEPDITDSNAVENSNQNGFINKFNTCFVAAALQCILRIQPLKDYFLSNLYTKDVDPDQPAKEKEFMDSVAEIFIGYFSTSNSALNIERFLEQLEWVFPGYVKGEQNDAQEFLVFFFDKVHTVLNRAHKSRVPLPEAVSVPDEVDRAWFEYLRHDKSIIIGGLSRHFSGPAGHQAQLRPVPGEQSQIRAAHVHVSAYSGR